jgi:hypothetical protein
MLTHLATHATEIKLTAAAVLGFSAWLADASGDQEIKGWEEIGLKGILLFAVYYIGRLFLSAQREHKAEMKETWDLHKTESLKREERMAEAMTKQTVSLEKLCEISQEQVEHFRAFVKSAVDEKMRPH